MDVAVVGTGSVGTALGTVWARAGHRVTFGSRTPTSDAARALADAVGHGARVVATPEAVRGADAVLLATPWPVTVGIVRALDLAGAVVLDATGPVGADYAPDVPDGSGAERVQAAARGARVVKAFNTTGAGNLADPAYPGGPLTMPVCGDDPAAKALAMRLASAAGFAPLDCGPLAAARELEALGRLWSRLAHAQGLGSGIGWALLR